MKFDLSKDSSFNILAGTVAERPMNQKPVVQKLLQIKSLEERERRLELIVLKLSNRLAEHKRSAT